MSKTLSITAQVNGSIEQDIKIIVDDLTPEQLLAGLKSGNYVTTISHSKNEGCGMVLELPSCRHVGNVTYQVALGDMEIGEFLGEEESEDDSDLDLNSVGDEDIPY